MNKFMIFTVFLIYGAWNVYTASRIGRMLKLLGLNIIVPFFAVVFSLLSTGVLFSFFGRKYGFQRILSDISSVWTGVLVYLLLFTLAADIILLIIRIAGKSSDRIRITAEAAVLVLTALTVIYGAIHACHIQTVRYTVDTGKNTAPLKIVLVSDIHLGATGIESRLSDMTDAINAKNADIVCIAGDIFNNDFGAIQNPSSVTEALGNIKSKYGVYACPGNHDNGSSYNKMTGLLNDAGITLLSEDYMEIPGICIIAGRADNSRERKSGDVIERLHNYITDESVSLPVIVLDHNPAHFDEYNDEVSLILCGHTHLGQIFPGSLITKSMYTVDYGQVNAADGKPAAIVTSGIGYWGPPLRVGTDSEIAVIELK